MNNYVETIISSMEETHWNGIVMAKLPEINMTMMMMMIMIVLYEAGYKHKIK